MSFQVNDYETIQSGVTAALVRNKVSSVVPDITLAHEIV